MLMLPKRNDHYTKNVNTIIIILDSVCSIRHDFYWNAWLLNSLLLH